mmetsp:Transcript_108230/g.323661  ORF Transcript_108230/g.323661 Transcript_108230/m.323661 type:complete len:94 (-) Transcript_108230:31-312(-)
MALVPQAQRGDPAQAPRRNPGVLRQSTRAEAWQNYGMPVSTREGVGRSPLLAGRAREREEGWARSWDGALYHPTTNSEQGKEKKKATAEVDED